MDDEIPGHRRKKKNKPFAIEYRVVSGILYLILIASVIGQ